MATTGEINGINSQTTEIAQRLRALAAYGPVRVITREPGYTAEKGRRPLGPDQRPRFALNRWALTVSNTDGTVNVTVATPGGQRNLPLDHIERVDVDLPLGHNMPLYGRQIMGLVLMPWKGHENVPRWAPRANELFDGSHIHQVLETGIDHPTKPKIGVVRAYDISTPWPRNTSLEAAKGANRPYGLYFISQLGSLSTEHGLTVITSCMGYRNNDRVATVLPPKHPPMAERAINMLDVTKRVDADVYEVHLERVKQLSTEHGEAIALRQIQVDDAFLYMSHD